MNLWTKILMKLTETIIRCTWWFHRRVMDSELFNDVTIETYEDLKPYQFYYNSLDKIYALMRQD